MSVGPALCSAALLAGGERLEMAGKTVEALPANILCSIMHELGPPTLARAACVSKLWRECADSSWEGACRRHPALAAFLLHLPPPAERDFKSLLWHWEVTEEEMEEAGEHGHQAPTFEAADGGRPPIDLGAPALREDLLICVEWKRNSSACQGCGWSVCGADGTNGPAVLFDLELEEPQQFDSAFANSTMHRHNVEDSSLLELSVKMMCVNAANGKRMHSIMVHAPHDDVDLSQESWIEELIIDGAEELPNNAARLVLGDTWPGPAPVLAVPVCLGQRAAKQVKKLVHIFHSGQDGYSAHGDFHSVSPVTLLPMTQDLLEDPWACRSSGIPTVALAYVVKLSALCTPVDEASRWDFLDGEFDWENDWEDAGRGDTDFPNFPVRLARIQGEIKLHAEGNSGVARSGFGHFDLDGEAVEGWFRDFQQAHWT